MHADVNKKSRDDVKTRHPLACFSEGCLATRGVMPELKHAIPWPVSVKAAWRREA
jgi:hypothetical protein